MGEHEPETIGELIVRTTGVMRTADMREVGTSRRALAKKVSSGELVRTKRAVYVLANVRQSHEADARIALATLGPSYATAHQSAAYIHGLLRYPPSEVHVARKETWGVREIREGLAIHRFGDLVDSDIVDETGMRVTTVERTLLDLAATATTDKDHRLMRFAVRAALTADSDLAPRLEKRLDERGPRRGSRKLRDAIGEWRATGLARSLVEVDFIEFCREHGLPLPQTNVVVLGAERDAVWFEQKVIGELDTKAHHLNEVAFEDDRLRDAEATAQGWRVVRATPLGMQRRGARVADVFRRLLLPDT